MRSGIALTYNLTVEGVGERKAGTASECVLLFNTSNCSKGHGGTTAHDLTLPTSLCCGNTQNLHIFIYIYIYYVTALFADSMAF